MNELDGIGIYGQVLHYAMVIAFTVGAFISLVYFWRKGILSFGEGPSIDMVNRDDQKGERDE